MGFSIDISVSNGLFPKVAPASNAMGTKPLQGEVEVKSALENLDIVDRKTATSSVNRRVRRKSCTGVEGRRHLGGTWPLR
jgi:hypothetical protein